jgi:uncharacterized protein
MKLHLTPSAGNQLITGYGNGWVEVNESRHTESLVVFPNLLLRDWNITAFDALTEAHFERLVAMAPEVVLLGTGETHRFIHPRLGRALTEANIGLECMTTAAACRTYNILMAEGRHVAAALIVVPTC